MRAHQTLQRDDGEPDSAVTEASPETHPWVARLSLEYSNRGGRSVLSHRSHLGPLVVQKPLYPEGDAVCHGIILHPPAGIAGGDELSITVKVGELARALLTTPGAGKWYRSAGATAKQQITLDVADGAVFEWLPQESMVFDGALGDTTTHVRLTGSARFIGFDLWCLGRLTRGEHFDKGRMSARLRIERDGRAVFAESARLLGSDPRLAAPAGLGGASVFGNFLVAAPDIDAALVDACRAAQPEQGLGAVTRLPGLLIARYRGGSAEAARNWFAALWAIARPIVAGRQACPPRIWNT